MSHVIFSETGVQVHDFSAQLRSPMDYISPFAGADFPNPNMPWNRCNKSMKMSRNYYKISSAKNQPPCSSWNVPSLYLVFEERNVKHHPGIPNQLHPTHSYWKAYNQCKHLKSNGYRGELIRVPLQLHKVVTDSAKAPTSSALHCNKF